VSHDSHKKIRLYYCDTDPARNASTTCKFVNMFATKTGVMRPNASFLYLASFTSSTNSTFQWYLSSAVTRVTYKNYGIKTKFNSSANPASDGLKLQFVLVYED